MEASEILRKIIVPETSCSYWEVVVEVRYEKGDIDRIVLRFNSTEKINVNLYKL